MRIIDLYLGYKEQEKLQEANLRQLYTKSVSETPKIAQRGQTLAGRVRYFGLSKDGTLNFKVASQTIPGGFYYAYIEAPDVLRLGDVIEEGDHLTEADLNRLLTMNGFRIHCNDPSYLYWSFQYMATKGNYEIEPETRAPKRNNTLLQGALCKHLVAVVKNIYENKKMRLEIIHDIENYLRMIIGLDYEDYQQLNHAKQIQQQNRAVKWKNKPSDYMNDYFARKAKNHQFLDDHDIKKSLKKEMNKFITTNPQASVDDFLRSYFQMTQKAFAEDMKIPEDSVIDYFDELGFNEKKEKVNAKRAQRNIVKSQTVSPKQNNSGVKSSILTKDSEQLHESESGRILYHCSGDKIEKFDTDHFGKSSTGGATYGDAIYFCATPEDAKDYSSSRKPYIYKSLVDCKNVISAQEYIKILNDEDKLRDYDGTVWNDKERRNIMLNHNIDAVDDLPSEFAVFNLDCIKSVSLYEIINESDLWKRLKPKINSGDYDEKCVNYWKEQIKQGHHRPILVNEDGEISDGNHTLTAYQELGIKPPMLYKGLRKDFFAAAKAGNHDGQKMIEYMIDNGQATLIEKEGPKSYLSPKEAHIKYMEYLEGHIGNVKEAVDLIIKCCDDEFIQEEAETLRRIAADHDKSKYGEEEFMPYLHHFYPTCPEEEKMTEAFEMACKHHIANNKHHWDFWLDPQTFELKDISDERDYKLHCVERVADWLSIAAQHDEDKSIWYEMNKKAMKMPDWAFEFIENIYKKLPDDYYLSLSYKGTRGKLDEREEI